MIISANFATYPGDGRPLALKKSVESIIDQVDYVRIWWNEYLSSNLPTWAVGNYKVRNTLSEDIDRKDNGKFHSLGVARDEYYFTCDDDLIYPMNYVQATIRHLKYKSIVCYHGRQLNTDGNFTESYYRGGHICYGFQNDIKKGRNVHVAGTGVMAIDTRKFHPSNIFLSELKGMADLVFSLEVAKNGKRIYLAPHNSGWITPIRVPESICTIAQNSDQADQVKLVMQIMNIKGFYISGADLKSKGI